MSKENKIEKNVRYALVIGASIVGTCIFTSIDKKNPQTNTNKYELEGQTIVGKSIELEDKAKAYADYKDAMIKINSKKIYFDQEFFNNYEFQTGEKLERIVIKAWYECGNEIETVELKENYQEKEQKILFNGGELLAVETTIDKTNYQPEAYYNSEDIKKITIIKINKKNQ